MGRLILLLASAACFTLSTPQTAQAKSVKKSESTTIRWKIAHNPGNKPLYGLLQKFSKQIESQSHGQLKIEVISEFNKDRSLHSTTLESLLAGEVEISQIHTGSLKKFEKQLHAFEMPYVFDSYKHAAAVIDGPVGEKLLKGVKAGSGNRVTPIAFTYSGGFRALYGSIPVKTLSDFEKLVFLSHGEIRGTYLKHYGSKIINGKNSYARPEYVKAHENGLINAEEGEVNRMYVTRSIFPSMKKKLNNLTYTKHAMFHTIMMVNSEFLKKLSPEMRTLLTTELKKFAIEERKLSIDLEKENLVSLKKDGVNIIEFDNKSQKEFKTFAKKYWKSFHDGKYYKTVNEIRMTPASASYYANK